MAKKKLRIPDPLVERPVNIRVFTKAKWADEWFEYPHLHLIRLSRRLPPALDEAHFEWRYGFGAQAGEETMQPYAPGDFMGQYVRVWLYEEFPEGSTDEEGEELSPEYLSWIGLFTVEHNRRDGWLTSYERPSGIQQWHAVGIEYLLTRRAIIDAVVEPTEGEEETVLRRPLAFNRDAKRAAADGASGPVFSIDNGETSQRWTGSAIVQHLLAYQTAYNLEFVSPFSFEPEGTVYLKALDVFNGDLETEGKTTFDLLSEVANIRRLLGWRVDIQYFEPNEFGGPEGLVEKVLVKFFSHTHEDLFYEDGELSLFIPASDRQWEIDYSDRPQVESFVISISETDVYDQVIVQGERVTSTMTLSVGDGSLTEGWTEEDAEAYGLGATEEDGYGELPPSEKRAANKRVRNSVELEHVYSELHLPSDWDGKLRDSAEGIPKDGEGEVIALPYVRTSDPWGTPPGSEPDLLWPPGVRLNAVTQLKAHRNYLDPAAASDPSEAPHDGQPGTEEELVDSFSVIEVSYARKSEGSSDPETITEYHYGHDLGHTGLFDLTTRGAGAWSVGLRVLRSTPGVRLNVHGADQHYIAHATASIQGDKDYALWREFASISYVNALVTVSLDLDYRVTQQWPPEGSETDEARERDFARVLLIQQPGMRLDYLTPHTVVGITDAKCDIHLAGGWLRDDRDKLNAIARVAYQWYSVPRRNLSLALNTVPLAMHPGDMILRIMRTADEAVEDDDPSRTNLSVRTVIQEITYQLRSGSQDAKTPIFHTTISTQAGQLDPTMFVRSQ